MQKNGPKYILLYKIFDFYVISFSDKIISSKAYERVMILLVHLSLLTMTSPNQLCAVLLFVCSKMADETNLSSKLPVAERTREV